MEEKGSLCVEVVRGDSVESFHRGRGVVVSSAGLVELSFGDIDKSVYPRSSIKAFQALPAVESGAVERFGFTSGEIALMGASHSGEPEHVATVLSMLDKLGLSSSALECGIHRPMGEAADRLLISEHRSASVLHNSCSGKHVGMLAYCLHEGIDYCGYIDLDHPVQRRIRETIEVMCGVDLGGADVARDGCSVPTWSFPLRSVAYGFARFGSGIGLSESLKRSCSILLGSFLEHPFMVAGTDRHCTRVMAAFGGRVFVKVGAEGVYCAALPDLGLGVALKCDDGSVRAAELMLNKILTKLIDNGKESLHKEIRTQIPMKNFNGYEIGYIRAVD